MNNKNALARALSLLQPFHSPQTSLEQYQTSSEIAASVLWLAHLHKDIHHKTGADLGCGTGLFGLGALLLGAKLVHFVDIDPAALASAQANQALLEKAFGKKLPSHFHRMPLAAFTTPVDVVIQNPPFGVQKSHADRAFLLKAMEISSTVYSLHKIESAAFIAHLVQQHGFQVDQVVSLPFPLKKTLFFHRKKTYYVDVGVWRIVKKRKP